MDTDSMECLDQRLSKLEYAVFGNEAPKEATDLVEQLRSLQTKLQTLLKQHDYLEKCISHARRWEELLSRPQLTAGATEALVEACSDLIEQSSPQLKSIQENERFLNTEKLQRLPSLKAELKPLEKVAMDQCFAATELHDRLQDMLVRYNKIVQLLMQKFVLWDHLITKLETSKT